MSVELVRYDAMCRAIDAAHAVDEVKDIRDKAVALQHYARQALNTEAERRAAEIRMRAKRKAGQLTAQIEKSKGGRPSKTCSTEEQVSTKNELLENLGITRKQASQWERLAEIPQEEFERALDESVKPPTTEGILRAAGAEQRRSERMAKLVELSRASAPLPSDRRFPIIYADPPWKFQVHSGPDNEWSAEQHYPAMSTEEICALPVTDIATPDAVLLLWTPACNLPDALRVCDAWGFEYVTCAVWVKPKAAFGYWVRTQHELLTIARRGAMPTPAPADRPPSVITAPRREHSRKPDEAYELIEGMFPGLLKVELFARARRPGWDCWGNETEKFAAAVDRSIEEDKAAWIREEIRTIEEKSNFGNEKAPAHDAPGPSRFECGPGEARGVCSHDGT
jgi:N6-adenosine-specific RNA methylase IME4